MPTLALIAPPEHPPERLVDLARAAEEAGLEELWIWEDCFAASGLAPAAAMLAATSRLRVGIGLMPVPLRAPSLTAMEIATIARMSPGRFLPGVGHGVLDWMGQAGVRVESPVTLLREHLEVLRALLAGEEVNREGRYVRLDRVRLRWPPVEVPPLLVGGRGPRTLGLAGELGDGMIVDDAAPGGRVDPGRLRDVVEQVTAARSAAGRAGAPQVVTFLPTSATTGAEQVADAAGALGEAGADTVAVFAGGVGGPPLGGAPTEALVEVLAAAATLG